MSYSKAPFSLACSVSKASSKMEGGLIGLIFACFAMTSIATAQEGSSLVKQLSNPRAAPISVPIQVNYNSGIGPLGNGEQYQVSIQPAIWCRLTEPGT